MAPATQKALVVTSERAPWELRTDWPVKSPGPKEVLIKLVSVALNPADWLIQVRGAPFVTYPFLGGLDGSGIIEEVGAEVVHLAKGDKVYVPLGSIGALTVEAYLRTLQPLSGVVRSSPRYIPRILLGMRG